MAVTLPPELAPALRERAEQLLRECHQAEAGELPPASSRLERSGRGACYVCHDHRGAMGGHHLVPGDDSSVVPVHASCHRKLHRKPRPKGRRR